MVADRRGGAVPRPPRAAAQLLAGPSRRRWAGWASARRSFQVAVTRRAAGPAEPAVEVDGERVAFDATGIDAVAFLIAPNPGEPARPLARIASGGELSRVALAIKQILAEADRTPTLVFDEIDAGIGGRSAEPVGRSLWALARTHQVLCVTHLGQIAAYADAQFRIEKHQRDGRTVTEVRAPGRGGARRGAGPDARRRRGRRRRAGQRRGAAGAGGRLAPRGRGMSGWHRGGPTAGDGGPGGSRPIGSRSAIEEFLVHLRVERGLSDATLRAYRADLLDFAASRGAAGEWDASRRRRGALSGHARPRRAGGRRAPLRPTTLRRTAAALRGFYRFCYAEGLIATDLAAHFDLPRQPRLLPEVLTRRGGGRSAGDAGRDDSPAGIRDRALLELLYA